MYIQAIREASFEIFTTICKLFNEFILDTELKFLITTSHTHLTIEWGQIVAHVAGLLQEFLTLLSKAKDRSARLNSKIMVPQTITPPPVHLTLRITNLLISAILTALTKRTIHQQL